MHSCARHSGVMSCVTMVCATLLSLQAVIAADAEPAVRILTHEPFRPLTETSNTRQKTGTARSLKFDAFGRRFALTLEKNTRLATLVAPTQGPALTDGDLTVDLNRRVAKLRGEPLALTVREFDLLVYLMRHPAKVFRRAELLEAVWGWNFGDQSTVTVHVRRLREKIERDPTMPERLVTVWGVGYRWEPQEVDVA